MSTIIRERLREALKKSGRKPTPLAEALGLHRQYISDFLRGKKEALPLDLLRDIARETGVEWTWLAGEDPAGSAESGARETVPRRDIPVHGQAAGATVGAMAISDSVIDWVLRPPGLSGTRDAYALFVSGTSMEPRYRTGEMVFINPHRPARPGDIVIIQTRNHDGAQTEAWIKEFVRRDPQTGDWIVRQYNPDSTVRIAAATVTGVHRVMNTNELFGV